MVMFIFLPSSAPSKLKHDHHSSGLSLPSLDQSQDQSCSFSSGLENSGKFEAKTGLLKNEALISLKHYKITKNLHNNIAPITPKGLRKWTRIA